MVKAAIVISVMSLLNPINKNIDTNIVVNHVCEKKVPSQIEVLDLQYKDGLLIINLDENSINYTGGTTAENEFIDTVLKWGFECVGAEKITLRVNDQIDGFPEGTIVYQQKELINK
ncbi:MAG: hypothetical protein ACRCSG_05390 [Cellulosilyticaceae bacterium]